MRCIIGLICLTFSVMLSFANMPKCVLLYYHHKPLPEDAVNLYDWIVLDADTPYMKVIREKSFYQRRKAKVLGYMSVGEIEKYRSYYQELKRFAVGENKMWDSLVADLRKKEYRDFLLNRVAKNIAERGFDGFFLTPLILTCLWQRRKSMKSIKRHS